MNTLKVNEIFESLQKVRRPRKREQLLSYLTGAYLGDGCKTTNSLIVSGKEKYLTSLGNNVIKRLKRKVEFRYDSTSMCGIFINGYSLTYIIKEEIRTPDLIFRYPEAFLAGVLDTDGSVIVDRSTAKEHYHISIEFYNTNLYYLSLIRKALDKLSIAFKETVITIAEANKLLQKNNKTFKANKDQHTIKVVSRAAAFYLGFLLKNYTLRELPSKRIINFLTEYWNYYKMKKLPISEIFSSINGEGLSIGIPQFFIRVYGCNLRCPGCDTSYAVPTAKLDKGLANEPSTKYTGITIKELLENFEQSNLEWVCLTGGEFTLYEYLLNALVTFLKCINAKITLQTNGTRYLPVFKLIDIIACDIKSPCTKVKSNLSVIEKLKPKDEVKNLIYDSKDWEFAKTINKLTRKAGCVHLLQPLDIVKTKDEYKRREEYLKKYEWLIEKVLKSKLQNVRVLFQIHKLVWGFNRKGV